MLDEKTAAKIKIGDILSIIFLAVAAIGVILLAVLYPTATVGGKDGLLILSYSLPPALIVVGAGGSAACNLLIQKKADKLIADYILQVCLNNPQAMHPERDSLTFYISLEGCKFLMSANGYKESLVFDFSAFKRLSLTRKAYISSEIGNRLTKTFCKLYDRGAKYKEVGFTFKNGYKKNKSVPIISGGVPDKKSYKIYLKTK